MIPRTRPLCYDVSSNLTHRIRPFRRKLIFLWVYRVLHTPPLDFLIRLGQPTHSGGTYRSKLGSLIARLGRGITVRLRLQLRPERRLQLCFSVDQIPRRGLFTRSWKRVGGGHHIDVVRSCWGKGLMTAPVDSKLRAGSLRRTTVPFSYHLFPLFGYCSDRRMKST